MNIEIQYLELLKDILENGKQKGDRTGTGTISLFGRQLRHTMSEGFPLLTTKKMYTKGIIIELLWFLRGDTNIKYLVDNGCNIWNGDAYKSFCNERLKIHKKIVSENPTCDFQPWEETISMEEFINKIKTDDEFAKKWGDLGPIYGKQWRNWEAYHKSLDNETRYIKNVNGIDQIQNLINDLKTSPDSRRLMVNAWNAAEIDQMVLPPCHYGFQVYTRELGHRQRTIVAQKMGIMLSEGSKSSEKWDKECDEKNIPKRAISLMWNQRSVDTLLGLPFNIASYAFLLCIIANEVNMIPDELICNLGDTHLYSNHIEQAKEQISRIPYQLPILKIGHFGKIFENISAVDVSDFIIEGYQSHSMIKAPLSN